MAFSQLHYTSCENGLSGYSGFQFCAVTSSIPREVMREVERNTIYELPSFVRETESESQEKFPVNLLFTYGAGSGVLLLSRVQFAGLDFSNRSGNYFAHSLISSNPGDLASFLPIELWDSPLWQSTQGTSPELPPIGEPLPMGPITRHLIAGFLASQPGSLEIAASLLTAAEEAIGAGRQLLLIGFDTDSVCRWIAAASYLLEPSLARQMTFSTYSYDPRRCRTHVVGTISDARPLLANLPASFHVFDLAGGTLPDLTPSSASQILARLGVAAAPDLWRLAESLGMSPASSLNDVLPALAGGALILGYRLTADEFGAAIELLGSEDSTVNADQLRTAAVNSLEQPLDEISAHQQHQLIEMSLSVESAEIKEEASLTSRIECAIVDNFFRRVDLDQPPSEGVRLKTQSAKAAAGDGCSRRLPSCSLDTAIELLAWATAVGVEPEKAAVTRLGQGAVFESLLSSSILPKLVEVAQALPELRTGVLTEGEKLPVERQRALVGGPARKIFQLEDFRTHPVIGVEWVFGMTRNHEMTPVAALRHILDLRTPRVHAPTIDEDLIKDLWPATAWTAEEAMALLDLLSPREIAADAVVWRLIAMLNDVPTGRGDPRGWMAFVTKLAGLPTGILPPKEAKLSGDLSRLIILIEDVLDRGAPDNAIEQLIAQYPSVNQTSKVFLDYCLPRLLLRHTRLGAVLEKCKRELFEGFTDFAANEIVNNRLSLAEIAAIYVSMNYLEHRNPGYSQMLEDHVLYPTLSNWKSDDINALGVEADRIMRNSSKRLFLWHRKSRRRRFPFSFFRAVR